jgi:hypothetical protein
VTLDEFFRLVASEPPVTLEREVRVAPPELMEEVRRRGGMMLTEFLADPRHTYERRTIREGHVLGPGLPREAIDDWARRWQRHPLPPDLVELLQRVNGIHLWADLDTGRAYEGIAPLREWALARTKMLGPDADPSMLEDRYLALSYHDNSDSFIVLNVDTGRYFDMEPYGADEGCPIGSCVGDVLEWVWRSRVAPRRDTPT